MAHRYKTAVRNVTARSAEHGVRKDNILYNAGGQSRRKQTAVRTVHRNTFYCMSSAVKRAAEL